MLLKNFPRNLGFGRNPIDQVYFESWEKASVAIKNAFNERSIFFSLYPFVIEDGTKFMLVDKISFDLEHEQKLENPLWEHRRISTVGSRAGADTVGICTRRGLHSHILIDPTWMPEKEAFRRVAMIQLKIINFLKLRTVCWDSVGDVSKLLRWPCSLYQDKKGKLWPIRCIEAFPEDEAADLKRERAKLVGFRVFDHDKIRHRATIDELERNLANTLPASRPNQVFTAMELPEDFQATEIMPCTMIFQKPCIRYWLSTGNPPPYIRFYAVVYLKQLGKTVEEIAHWFRNLGMAVYDYQITRKYVERAYEKYVYLPGHRKLRARGLCLKENCPQFRPELDEGDAN
jgi:hypothetical protein